MSEAAPPSSTERRTLHVRGLVQGVGFRPFAHRLATQLALHGWVCNTAQGAQIEIEGPTPVLEQFLHRLQHEVPTPGRIDQINSSPIPRGDPSRNRGFEIHYSTHAGPPTALILPDLAICGTCLAEVLDPSNRRYLHPFANCTHCGPRFSIVEQIPYDRAHTSMRHFPMCAACHAEYHDPANRRFHAQPIACPHCGPTLSLRNPQGTSFETGHNALLATAHALQNGSIVAVKSIGGFHLMAAADTADAVARLRQRKHREEKPFALMFASVESIRSWCEVSPAEAALLESPQAPIVLLRRLHRPDRPQHNDSFPGVAPRNPYLGCMLPPTALHHLLLHATQHPLVATSANLQNEPIATDNAEALHRLHDIADLFLVHDRPIVRPIDDSLVRIVANRPLLLRRARGYAPLPVHLPSYLTSTTDQSGPALAVGGHLKNTVAVAVGPHAFLSQHIGDLETVPALDAHAHIIQDLQRLHQTTATRLAADSHPDYASSRYAEQSGLPTTRVQHHYAHLLACLADNQLAPPALGVIWDGTGDGGDGTIWGGEFLCAAATGFERIAWLRSFPLPGGAAAIREPRRAALGLLYEMLGDSLWLQVHLPTLRAFSAQELRTLRSMLERRLNCPRTSSIGRFFDAFASLIGLRQISHYEGQAALELESAATDFDAALTPVQPEVVGRARLSERAAGCMPPFHSLGGAPGRTPTAARWDTKTSTPTVLPTTSRCTAFTHFNPISLDWRATAHGWIADWQPFLFNLLDSIGGNTPRPQLAHHLHSTLAATIIPAAQRASLATVALSGGCFQNKLLTELAITQLRYAGFNPVWHHQIPPNDGGLALGQLVATLTAQHVPRHPR